jgi:hypothetical protein
MADSTNPSGYLKLCFAFLAATIAALAMWAHSEKRHAAEWREAFQRQQDAADKAQVDAGKIRAQVAQLQGTVEAQEQELRNLRNLVANAPQNPPPLPQGIPLGPFAPVPNNGKRGWGPEQATGAPDTLEAGDHVTAWASLGQDDRDEWLVLEYAEAVTVKTVKVYENYKPGALSRVISFGDDGKEVELWKGIDPTPPTAPNGVSEVAAAPAGKTKRIKIYIDSQKVAGWNEIDAVGIVDERGTTHWAVKAEASSTYAAQGGALAVPERPVELAPREF